MNLNDVAKKLADDIYNSTDIQDTLEKVKKYMDKLVYSENNQPISKADKKKIVSSIKNILQDYQSKYIFESDNSSYIELLNMISEYLEDDDD